MGAEQKSIGRDRGAEWKRAQHNETEDGLSELILLSSKDETDLQTA